MSVAHFPNQHDVMEGVQPKKEGYPERQSVNKQLIVHHNVLHSVFTHQNMPIIKQAKHPLLFAGSLLKIHSTQTSKRLILPLGLLVDDNIPALP